MRRLLFILVFLLGACSAQPPQPRSAVLQGHVTIGPLSPVVQEGVPEPTPAPELYAGRMVRVFAEDGQTLITEAPVNADGTYRVELAPGTYVVMISLVGIEFSKDLPATVPLDPDQTVTLDIGIDTGIR